MIDLSNIKNYYIACGYTDLRRGIDGLAQIVMLQYGYEIDDAAELSVADGGLGDRAEKGHKKVPPKGYVLAKKWLKHWTFQ